MQSCTEPSRTDTVMFPALRLLPPVQPDRRTGWTLTRRGRAVRDMVAGAVVLGAALLVEPAMRLYADSIVAFDALVSAL